MTATTTASPQPTATRSRFLTRERAWPLGFTLLVLVIFVIFQWIVPESSREVRDFLRDWLSISTINECVIWATMAIGLNIVVGYAGLLDLGYVAFWAIGGYVAGWLMSDHFSQWKLNIFGQPAPGLDRGIHFSFWLVLPIAGLFCAFWGLIIGAPTLRLKSDYLALVTLGFGEIIPEVFRNGENVNGFDLTAGTKGITPIDAIPTGWLHHLPLLDIPARLGQTSAAYPWKFLVYCLIAAFAIFVSLRIREGRLGRAWLAIREDELAASMMGVPLMRTKLAAYAVGAFIGGVGGVMYASHVGGVIPDTFAFSGSIILLAMVVLGGMGNVWGVLVGALVLQWINANGLARIGDAVNGAFGADIDFPSYNFLIFGLILILMMLFRREGLLPETRTRQVLQEPERGEIESLGADLEGETK
jgi:branched-chain amino acid transport system permease protein